MSMSMSSRCAAIAAVTCRSALWTTTGRRPRRAGYPTSRWARQIYLGRVGVVADRSRFSAQTLSVLAALEADPAAWLHGYLIAKQTGLASGTLYPILIRLADRRLIEACWEDEQPAGRPRRHLYRLTGEGLVAARTALSAAARRRRPATGRTAQGRLAAEGGA